MRWFSFFRREPSSPTEQQLRLDKIAALKAAMTELSTQMQYRLRAGMPFLDLLLRAEDTVNSFKPTPDQELSELYLREARCQNKASGWLTEARQIAEFGEQPQTAYRVTHFYVREDVYEGVQEVTAWAATEEAAQKLKPDNWHGLVETRTSPTVEVLSFDKFPFPYEV